MYHNNVIELFPTCSRDFDFDGYNRRAQMRFRARQRREGLLALTECFVMALIGVGFTACVVLTVTML